MRIPWPVLQNGRVPHLRPRLRNLLIVVVAALVVSLLTAAGAASDDGDAEPLAPGLAQGDDTQAGPLLPTLATSQRSAAAKKRPNIILITTDDQATTDLLWMPKTIKYLARRGVSFTRALSPHPLCCPARAAILTGQYAQNNGVKSNQDPFNFKALDIDRALPVWLDRAGYNTAFTGKYLNGYGTHGKPQPGWDYWDATMINPYAYLGYQMYQNGNPEWYKKLNNVDYINKRMISLVDDWAPSDKPFFIWASHVAPHGLLDSVKKIPSTAKALPPERYANLFTGVDSPSLKDPGYTRDRTGDKNSLVRSKRLPSRQKVNEVFRSRIRALQGVDAGIEKLVRKLRAMGELDNTYIIFTSDNGFLVGEHNLITKNVPYRQSIRVPLMMTGPGLPKATVRSQRALMIDLAPTIAEIAGAKPLLEVDGTSLLPAARRNAPLRDTVLIQAGPQTSADLPYGWWWRGVTTDRYTYARFFADGIEELYDHQNDPSETDNVADDPRYLFVLAEMRRRTQQLVTCAGLAECSRDFGPAPIPISLGG